MIKILICILAGLISVGSTIYMLINVKKNYSGIVHVLQIISLIFFMVIGFIIPDKTEIIKPNNIKIVRYEYNIVIIADYLSKEFKDVLMYKKSDSSNIFIKKEYNTFGGLSSLDIILDTNKSSKSTHHSGK